MNGRPPHRALLPLVALVVGSSLAACGRETPQLEVRSAEAPAGPRVVAVDPPNGSVAVDPARTTLSVTFDREMDPQGWAWVVENPGTAPELGDSSFDPSGRVNTVEARLEPGRTYVVWVNSRDFPYFRDLAGVSATPFRWSFTTRADGAESIGGAAAAASAPTPEAGIDLISSRATTAPRVVRFEPPNGATGVDPGLTELRATFDRPMAEGWSWVTEGPESFPETTGEAFQVEDRRVAVLPVRLEPGRSYVVWLNSAQYRFFRAPDGVELAPVRWTFRTADAR